MPTPSLRLVPPDAPPRGGFRLSPLGRRVLSRYHGAGVATRLFLNARWRWTPYEAVAARLPASGTILDLGSGHGLLSLALAMGGPGRTVRGTDHDARRVGLARRAAEGVANLEFTPGNLLDAAGDGTASGTVAGVVVLDALHYLSHDEQELFLARCRAALREPDGVLLVRDVDAGAGPASQFNRLYERVMTGLGITRAERLHFRSRAGWIAALAGAGFDVACEPCGRFPFADLLFACRVAGAAARAA